MIGDTSTRVLLAVIAQHDTEGRATVDGVAARVGRSKSVTHRHLSRLRTEGLVAWVDGRRGTLRPLVAAT